MPIYSFCTQCKTTSAVNARYCARCGVELGRSRSYRVVVTVRGRTVARVLPNLTLARETEAAVKADLLRGRFDILEKRVPTLDEVWRRYLPYAQERKKTWKDDLLYYQKHVQPLLGSKTLDKISQLDLERLRATMQKAKTSAGRPYSAQTIKHQFCIIRRLFNVAHEWGLYDGPNPVSKARMPRMDNEIVRYLSDEELGRLLDVLSWWPCRQSAVFVKFAILTGMRRGELMRLQWSDIDEVNRLVTLRKPKGGKTVTVPVCQEAIEALQELPRESSWVFPGKGGGPRTDFKGPWLRIKRQAGLPENFRLHDLRHHFASGLVSHGVPLEVVSKLLTHKTLAVTQRYAHLQPAVLRQAADLVGQVLTVSEKATETTH